MTASLDCDWLVDVHVFEVLEGRVGVGLLWVGVGRVGVG